MITTIIFDWGSVIAPSDSKTAVGILKKNFELNESDFLEYFSQYEDEFCDTNNYEDFLSIANQKFNIPIDLIINALNSASAGENLEIATQLSEKYETYILSNQLKFRTDYIKKTFDLSSFEKVFFSNEIGMKKPSEEIFRFLLKDIDKAPEECLFIDDMPENISIAKKLGLNVIQLDDINQLKQELVAFGVYH